MMRVSLLFADESGCPADLAKWKAHHMEIFERIPGSVPVWVEATDALGSEPAMQRLIMLCVVKPGNYFAYDEREGQIVAEVSVYPDSPAVRPN
jgi:hypothetical protein